MQQQQVLVVAVRFFGFLLARHVEIQAPQQEGDEDGEYEGQPGFRLLDTLAQTGTAGGDNSALLQGRLVYGAGSDLSDIAAWQGRAKRKSVTQAVVLSLIKVAEQKGATERVKAYWNTYHCQEKYFSSEGRVYGSYCKNRFCTLCCSIRKAQLINQYLPEIRKWEDPHFVTLTVKAVPVAKLDRWFFGMFRAFEKIRENGKYKFQKGEGPKLIGIKSFECNFNPRMKTYNPHFHLLVPNAEVAETLIDAWLKKWTRKFTIRDAQHYRRVNSTERDLVELIKYGAKIFTDPDMKRKPGSQIPQMVYAGALDNIYSAMKPYRLFDRFGFNLPKHPAREKQPPTVLEDYDEWDYDPALHDWHNLETGELLAGYRPAPQLQWILGQSIDTNLQ